MTWKFSHNNQDDTVLFPLNTPNYKGIQFCFFDDNYELESYKFSWRQNELFVMISDYFEAGQHADIFDDLSLPAQDALFNALLWLDQRKLEV